MRLAMAGLFVCGCASSTAVPYQLASFEAAPPPLPAACDRAASDRGARWLVFVQDDCLACEDWLHELSERRAELPVSIEVVVVGTDRCRDAQRVAGRHGFSLRAASSDDEEAWLVTSTPLTYHLRDRAIRGRLEGSAPLAVLRAAGWLAPP